MGRTRRTRRAGAQDADDDGIKKAYRKLSMIWHPDKMNEAALTEHDMTAEQAEAKFIEISKAHDGPPRPPPPTAPRLRQRVARQC